MTHSIHGLCAKENSPLSAKLTQLNDLSLRACVLGRLTVTYIHQETWRLTVEARVARFTSPFVGGPCDFFCGLFGVPISVLHNAFDRSLLTKAAEVLYALKGGSMLSHTAPLKGIIWNECRHNQYDEKHDQV